MTALSFEQRTALRQLVGAAMRRRYRRELRMNLWGDDRPIENRNLGPQRPSRRGSAEPVEPVPDVVPRNRQVVPDAGIPGTTKWFPQVVLTCTCTCTSTSTRSKNTYLAGKQAGPRARTRERRAGSMPCLPACLLEGTH